MPPKRARNISPVTPARKAPTRNAKTRSAASTASMYKESEAYLEFSSDESLHQISDPEDILTDDNAQESEDDEDENGQESDAFDKPTTTRSGKAPRSSAKSGGKSSTKDTARKSTEKGRVGGAGARAGTAAKARTNTKPAAVAMSPPTSSSAASKNSARKTAPQSSAVSTTPGSLLTAPKRKAGNIRFAPLGSSPASSSSSSTSASSTPTSTISSPSARTKATSKSKEPNDHDNDNDQWAEKYSPMDISEVAVHAGKISSVREWLQTYTDLRNRNQDTSGGAVLVLSGPSGSGKTTVLKLLAQEMNLSIVEWINSVNENNVIQRATMPGEDKWRASSIDEEYVPVMRAFQEFFSRAQRFNPLGAPRDSTSSAGAGGLAPLSSTGKKNIILIEDLPPVTAFSSRKIFQDTITKFSNNRNNSTAVLVIIVSDVFTKQSTELLFSNTNENRDPALTIRTLLPSSILDKIDSGGKGCARIKQIKFNPIAPTIMKKAIKKLVEKEFRTAHTYAPDTTEIEQAIEIHDGDIRAVINSLQFLCYVPSKKRKRYREAAEALEAEKELLHFSENRDTVGQDSSLGVFHAVAKVLYNRRDWTSRVEFDRDVVKIPAHAWTKQRPPLRFSPEKDLIEKLPIEPDLYALMLHQNYTRHMTKIEDCQTAIDYLCIADQFSHSSNNGAAYTQMIQMQPYMTSVAVRGLLFAPTTQGPSFVGGNGGQKKHWWPELFGVNRIMRTNEQMYGEVAADLAGEEAKGLSSGHVNGPGYYPKRVVREELVPMLHKCISMNPYLSIFNQSLRSSSKTFVKNGAGSYGKKVGVIKKEFGEGDEGFLEEVAQGGEGGVDEIVDETGMAERQRLSQQQQQQQQPQQQHQQRWQGKQTTTYTYEISKDEDPIEDFSD